MAETPASPRFGVAFLLAQLGAHATDQFARALAEYDMTPPMAGILRRLKVEPGLSQQRLAELLGTAPSRIVSYVDDLEARGWISRNRTAADRRVNVLGLTEAGQEAVEKLGAVSRDHDDRFTAKLDDDERSALHDLLTKLAASHGLTRGVHPGYRKLDQRGR